MAGARAIRNSTRLDQLVLGACMVLSVAALVLPVNIREPVAATLRRSLLAPLLNLQERMELTRRAFLLHGERTAARDSVTLRALSVAALESENDRLRRVIGLGTRLRWGFVPAEALHGRGVRDAYSVILSAGSRAGVRRLSPVVTAEGLVGMVERVDPTMSHAIVWTHPDFRVSAMSADGSAFGIVQAHLGGPGSRFMLEMRGVPFRSTVRPGTMIVSAGLGGTYPRGIPIGVVVGEIKTSEAWARTYMLRPAVLPADINSVMILRPERVAAGVENLWQFGTPTDSALRAILATGDSIAKSAALAEAAARRAVIDSLRVDSVRRAGGGIPVFRPVGTQPRPAQPRPVATPPIVAPPPDTTPPEPPPPEWTPPTTPGDTARPE
jgi:rod shape-determining protein MreC